MVGLVTRYPLANLDFSQCEFCRLDWQETSSELVVLRCLMFDGCSFIFIRYLENNKTFYKRIKKRMPIAYSRGEYWLQGNLSIWKDQNAVWESSRPLIWWLEKPSHLMFVFPHQSCSAGWVRGMIWPAAAGEGRDDPAEPAAAAAEAARRWRSWEDAATGRRRCGWRRDSALLEIEFILLIW